MGQGGHTLDGYHLWQPFTQMQTFLREEGIIIEQGDGPYLVDVNGKEYLNMTSSVWNVPYGLGQDEIVDAISAQLKKLGYGSLLRAAHPEAIELAALVADITPGKLNRVFFTSNGSESIETGIKMARAYWAAKGSRKHKVLSLKGAYHGCSYGALSASGFDDDKEGFHPLLPGFHQIEPPYCYRCPFGLKRDSCQLECAHALESAIIEHDPDEVALFLIEPVQGLHGVIIPSQDYFDVICRICDKYDVLLMVDEVTTGFGRTGEMFAVNHWNVEPDLMALGKAMSAGYWPLGATVATDEIWKQFLGSDNKSRFNHGSTFSGHPGGSAAGSTAINKMLNDNIAETAKRKGEYFYNKLRELDDLPIVGDVRGIGMMFAVELVRDRETKDPLDAELMKRIVMACFAGGVWVHVGGSTLMMLPPFIVDEALMDEAARRLRKVLRASQHWI